MTLIDDDPIRCTEDGIPNKHQMTLVRMHDVLSASPGFLVEGPTL